MMALSSSDGRIADRGSRIRVAILGSGMSGCAAASTLLESSSSSPSSSGKNNRFDITVYEAGRGVGGRMSTRVATDDGDGEGRRRRMRRGGGRQRQFDHGCQFVGPAKTPEFAKVLGSWHEGGWVAPWGGRFRRAAAVVASGDGDGDGDGDGEGARIVLEEEEEEEGGTTDGGGGGGGTTATATAAAATRYVGIPRMSSICENLLAASSSSTSDGPSGGAGDTSTLRVITHARATAMRAAGGVDGVDGGVDGGGWRIVAGGEGEGGGIAAAGFYDWLVVTDRSSARSHDVRLDDDGDDDDDAGLFSAIHDDDDTLEYYPICATMIALDGTLDVPADGIEIDEGVVGGTLFGTLGWMSRDSSRPGRRPKGGMGGSVSDDDDDDDGGGGGGGGGGREECWVLHSTKEGARRMLEETKGGTLDEVREGIRRTMVEDFERAMPLLLLASSATAAATTAAEASSRLRPTVVHSAGHRWGAAFPAHDDDVPGSSAVPRRMDCHLDAKRRVVACGDYFGAHRGTAEGAYLSGRAAAERLMGQVNS